MPVAMDDLSDVKPIFRTFSPVVRSVCRKPMCLSTSAASSQVKANSPFLECTVLVRVSVGENEESVPSMRVLLPLGFSFFHNLTKHKLTWNLL